MAIKYRTVDTRTLKGLKRPEMGQFLRDLAAFICTLILGSSLWLTIMMLGLILEG